MNTEGGDDDMTEAELFRFAVGFVLSMLALEILVIFGGVFLLKAVIG